MRRVVPFIEVAHQRHRLRLGRVTDEVDCPQRLLGTIGTYTHIRSVLALKWDLVVLWFKWGLRDKVLKTGERGSLNGRLAQKILENADRCPANLLRLDFEVPILFGPAGLWAL